MLSRKRKPYSNITTNRIISRISNILNIDQFRLYSVLTDFLKKLFFKDESQMITSSRNKLLIGTCNPSHYQCHPIKYGCR